MRRTSEPRAGEKRGYAASQDLKQLLRKVYSDSMSIVMSVSELLADAESLLFRSLKIPPYGGYFLGGFFFVCYSLMRFENSGSSAKRSALSLIWYRFRASSMVMPCAMSPIFCASTSEFLGKSSR